MINSVTCIFMTVKWAPQMLTNIWWEDFGQNVFVQMNKMNKLTSCLPVDVSPADRTVLLSPAQKDQRRVGGWASRLWERRGSWEKLRLQRPFWVHPPSTPRQRPLLHRWYVDITDITPAVFDTAALWGGRRRANISCLLSAAVLSCTWPCDSNQRRRRPAGSNLQWSDHTTSSQH